MIVAVNNGMYFHFDQDTDFDKEMPIPKPVQLITGKNNTPN